MVAEKTPQTEAATQELLGNVAAFKSDPKPLLEKHGIRLTDEEHENLKAHLAKHDVGTLSMTLSQSGLHMMFSQKS